MRESSYVPFTGLAIWLALTTRIDPASAVSISDQLASIQGLDQGLITRVLQALSSSDLAALKAASGVWQNSRAKSLFGYDGPGCPPDPQLAAVANTPSGKPAAR